MCVLSFVGDNWSRRIPESYPWTGADFNITQTQYGPSREEFEALKKDLELMREELKAAKAQDIAEGNPDCEMEEKVALLKKVAEICGVDLSEVFGK